MISCQPMVQSSSEPTSLDSTSTAVFSLQSGGETLVRQIRMTPTNLSMPRRLARFTQDRLRMRECKTDHRHLAPAALPRFAPDAESDRLIAMTKMVPDDLVMAPEALFWLRPL